jgi:hypothetical protein
LVAKPDDGAPGIARQEAKHRILEPGNARRSDPIETVATSRMGLRRTGKPSEVLTKPGKVTQTCVRTACSSRIPFKPAPDSSESFTKRLRFTRQPVVQIFHCNRLSLRNVGRKPPLRLERWLHACFFSSIQSGIGSGSVDSVL